MKKNLKYYMNLNYTVEINKLSDEDGGGYHACIPQLGKFAFQSDGDTVDGALKNLEIIKEEWFSDYLKKSIAIPEPVEESEISFSGKFLVRVPKELHGLIAKKAKESEISLNQYVQYLISSAITGDICEKKLDKVCNQFQKILDDYNEVHYDIKSAKEHLEFNQFHYYEFNKAV